MLIQPVIHVVTMEADMCAEGDMASDTSLDVVQWKSIIVEYSNVFDPLVCLLNATLFIELSLKLAQYHHTGGSTEFPLLSQQK